MMAVLLFLHVLGVMVWVGGMVFVQLCLRPVAAVQLAPPQRLPLLAAVLGRFFALVAIAIVLVLASGFGMFAIIGEHVPKHWHVMAGVGLLMVAIYGWIVVADYPRLTAAVAAQDWPAGAAAMNNIRRKVVTNIVLALVATAAAMAGAWVW